MYDDEPDLKDFDQRARKARRAFPTKKVDIKPKFKEGVLF